MSNDALHGSNSLVHAYAGRLHGRRSTFRGSVEGMNNDLRYPIGKFVRPASLTQAEREEALQSIAELPEKIAHCRAWSLAISARYSVSRRRLDRAANRPSCGRQSHAGQRSSAHGAHRGLADHHPIQRKFMGGTGGCAHAAGGNFAATSGRSACSLGRGPAFARRNRLDTTRLQTSRIGRLKPWNRSLHCTPGTAAITPPTSPLCASGWDGRRSPHPEQLALQLQTFLDDQPAAVLMENGRILFDLRLASTTVAAEHGHCVLHVWSEERNVFASVVDITVRKTGLRLHVLRMGQTKPQTIELQPQQRRLPSQRDTTRTRFIPLLERLLPRYFPDFKVEGLRTAMDLERSFGPSYARGMLVCGNSAWAVIAINGEESQALVDGILTFGVLWLHHCREHSGGRRLVEGLRLILPRGKSAVTAARLAWMNARAAKWELYELDEKTEELYQREYSDQGNLDSRLVHAPNIIGRRGTLSFRHPARAGPASAPCSCAYGSRLSQRQRGRPVVEWPGVCASAHQRGRKQFCALGRNSVRQRRQRDSADRGVRADNCAKWWRN